MTEAQELRAIELAKAETIERARRGLLAFTKWTWSDYQVNWHHRVLCKFLNNFVRGKIKRAMVFLPPRTGKSELVSRRLPAFLHGKYPDAEIMFATYSAELASDMTVDVQRIMDRPEYRELFPHSRITSEGSLSKYARNKLEHELIPIKLTDGTTYYPKGSFRAAGAGGAFTGRGANCFAAPTLVYTEIGSIPIKELSNHIGLNVYSLNEKGNIVLKPIVAWKERLSSEILEIVTEKGKTIHCTPCHRIATTCGYKQAHSLRPEDIVISGSMGSNELYPVQNYLRKTTIRCDEVSTSRFKTPLLFEEMLRRSPCNKESSKMRNLRWSCGEENKKILCRLSEEIKFPEAIAQEMSCLHEKFSTGEHLCDLMFTEMRKVSTFPSDERKRESKISKQQAEFGSSSSTLSQDTSIDKGEGFIHLCGLWEKGQACSSHRPQSKQQFTRELDNYVRSMSHDTPSISFDTVSVVRKTRRGSFPVYDIQVEGTHNFFAEGILVHNCIIIDDIFKNREDADSPTYRNKIWKFYTSTLYSRLEKDGQILLTTTRWHEDDLAGRLLRLAMSDPEADQWEVLSLPAIREDANEPRDPRMIGEPLWSNKYNLDALTKIRKNSARDWAALYQQKPTAEDGNIIKANWFKYYSVLPARFDQVIDSWDFAVKDKSGSDYSVGQKWGRIGANKYLIAQIRGRFPFPTACQKVTELKRMHAQTNKVLIEAKANGPAVKQTLSKHVSGIVEIEPRGDKIARVNAISPEFEGGSVWLPSMDIAPWINEFIGEMTGFPHGVNDDIVDSCTQALDELRKATAFYSPVAGHGTGLLYA